MEPPPHGNLTRGSPGNPPSLYDTSTSTAESQSTGSAGRRMLQPLSKPQPPPVYPPYYFPQGRPETRREGQPNNMKLSRSLSDYRPRGIRATQSDTGVSSDHDHYSNFMSRLTNSSRQSTPVQAASDIGVASVSDKIRKYNRSYPDPTMEPSNSEERQEPRQPSTPRAQTPREDPVRKSRQNYRQPSPLRHTGSADDRPRNLDHQRRLSDPPASTSRPMPQSVQSSPVPNERKLGSIETPTSGSVRDLKKQLWNDKEVLQVAVPPTLQDGNDAPRTPKTPRRRARSQSPAPIRRSFSTDNDASAKFNSKYYEAALAARMKGRNAQPEVQQQLPANRGHPSPGGRTVGTTTSSSSLPYDEGGRTTLHKDVSPTDIQRTHPVVQPLPPQVSDHSELAPRSDSPSFDQNPLNAAFYVDGSTALERRASFDVTHSHRPNTISHNQYSFEAVNPKAETPLPTNTNRMSPRVPPHNRPATHRHPESPAGSRRTPSADWKQSTHEPPKSKLRSPSVERKQGGVRRAPSSEPTKDRRSEPRLVRTRSHSLDRKPIGHVEQQRENETVANVDQRQIVPEHRRASRQSPTVEHRRAIPREPQPSSHFPEPHAAAMMPQGRRELEGVAVSPTPAKPPTIPSNRPAAKHLVRHEAESSFERLAREFSGEIEHMQPPSPGVAESPHDSDHARNKATLSSRQSSFDDSMKKFSSLEQKPSPVKDPYLRHNLPTGAANERGQADSFDHSDQRQIADMDTSWQEKARASPVPTPDVPPDTEAEAKGNEKRVTNDSTTTEEKRSIDDLVAKLSAVNRDNPTEALAQIDSILRREGDNSGGLHASLKKLHQGAPNPFDERYSNADESDADTSVSSLTNPTYQVSKPGRDQVKVTSPQNAPPQDPISENAPNTGHPHPSTSTFRRPRPSALQQYMTSTHPDPAQSDQPTMKAEATPTNMKEETGQPQMSPPPTSIEVSDTPVQTSPLLTTSGVQVTFVDGNMDAPPAQEEVKVEHPQGGNPVLSDQEALAAKIRAWDDMSNGVARKPAPDPQAVSAEEGEEVQLKPEDLRPSTEFEAAPTTLPALPKVNSKRNHPWDGEVPARVEKVDVRDTSMEDAVGVETAMTIRGKNMGEANQFAAAATAAINAIIKPGNNVNESFESAPNPFLEPQGHSGGWEVSPRLNLEQHQNAQKISADFDAAWASMPNTSGFPPASRRERHNRPDPPVTSPSPVMDRSHGRRKASTSRPHPVDLDQSFESSCSPQPALPKSQRQDIVSDQSGMEQGAIEVSLLPDSRYADTSGEASNATPVASTPDRQQKPKKRGFLRAFMRKEKKKHTKSSSVNQSSLSGSQASAGARSMPASTKQQQVITSNVPLSRHGVVQQEEAPPPRERGRTTSLPNRKPPQRSRSASLERFRSSSMAQKFSRVMRLYDQDGEI